MTRVATEMQAPKSLLMALMQVTICQFNKRFDRTRRFGRGRTSLQEYLSSVFVTPPPRYRASCKPNRGMPFNERTPELTVR